LAHSAPPRPLLLLLQHQQVCSDNNHSNPLNRLHCSEGELSSSSLRQEGCSANPHNLNRVNNNSQPVSSVRPQISNLQTLEEVYLVLRLLNNLVPGECSDLQRNNLLLEEVDCLDQQHNH
jgi:hypothetical protein